MKVFVWLDVQQASSAYHSEGGVVVFAEDEAAARALANAQEGCQISDREMPDVVRDMAPCDPQAFIFPDAGCC